MSERQEGNRKLSTLMRKYRAERLAFEILSKSKKLSMIGDVKEPFFLWVSQSWLDYLGYSEDYLTSHSFFDLIHPDDMEDSLKAFSRFQETGRIGFDEKTFTNRYKAADGTYKAVIWDNVMPTDGNIYMVTASTENDKGY